MSIKQFVQYGLWILFAFFCIRAIQNTHDRTTWTEWPASGIQAYPATIEQAVGYAYCFNPIKAEEITNDVLAKYKERAVLARVWWVRTLAWGLWCVNYRDASMLYKYEDARKKVEQLHPGLQGDLLAALDAQILFYVKQPNVSAEENLTQIKKEMREKEKDPIAQMRLGKAYLTAADLLKANPERSAELKKKAADVFQSAIKLVPESFEMHALFLTALIGNEENELTGASTESLKHAVSIAQEGLKHFDKKRPYFFDLQGPELLLVNLKYQLAIKENPKEKPVYNNFYIAGINETERSFSVTQAATAALKPASSNYVKEWQDLVKRIENNKAKPRGYDMLLWVKAYYKLATAQFAQGQIKEALATYKKLAAISPCYAEVDANMAAIYLIQAEQAQTLAERQRLQGLARDALAQQTLHNWQGTATETAKQKLENFSW